jgi:hypothetical protein
MAMEKRSSDEEKILEVVETPEAALEASAGDDESSEALVRLYTELLGILPHELPPVEPRPEIKRKILAAIPTDRTRDDIDIPAAAPVAAAPVPEPQATVLPWAPPEPASRTKPAPRAVAPRWPLALAALFFLALLGGSALFYGTWARQSQEIGRLRGELAAAADRAQAAESRLASGEQRASHRMRQLEDRLNVVAAPTVVYSSLEPTPESGLATVSGKLFVSPDHQHWYLTVHGLSPAEPGKHYRLWFVDEKGQPVSAGVLEIGPGGAADMAAPTMPSGVQTAVVTVEVDPRDPLPHGPAVLKGTPSKIL